MKPKYLNSALLSTAAGLTLMHLALPVVAQHFGWWEVVPLNSGQVVGKTVVSASMFFWGYWAAKS